MHRLGLALLIILAFTITAGAMPCLEPGPTSILPPAAVTLTLDRAEVREGQAVFVTVHPAPPAFPVSALVVSGPGPGVRLMAEGDAFVGWYPVPLGTSPDEYELLVVAQLADGRETRLVTRILVTRDDFPVQHLRVSSTLLNLGTDTQRVARDRAALIRAYQTTAVQSLSSGPFIEPATGRISTEFGVRRYVNGRLRGFHYGIDVAAPAGTPVVAANSGQVVLAADLLLQGNTVIIDHGQGLHSVYYHLQSWSVEPGQVVSQGELIGEIGSTGFSTGPHLHWEIRAAGVSVNPHLFLVDREELPIRSTGDRL